MAADPASRRTVAALRFLFRKPFCPTCRLIACLGAGRRVHLISHALPRLSRRKMAFPRVRKLARLGCGSLGAGP